MIGSQPVRFAAPQAEIVALATRVSKSSTLVVVQEKNMSTFGQIFRVTTFGESHCKGVGAIIDGCPSRLWVPHS